MFRGQSIQFKDSRGRIHNATLTDSDWSTGPEHLQVTTTAEFWVKIDDIVWPESDGAPVAELRRHS